ncbi:MAG: hypothetical protein J6Q22_09785 [Prevotella sp.]|nr:hypothetical protein [Prevotella sp.]
MRKQNKNISIYRAKAIVRDAMKVIVDFMVGESLDKESYQKKYDKVSAVDDEVIDVLGSADFNDDKVAEELYRLAKDINDWNNDHLSFFCGEPCPERWMFKTMI